MKKLIIAFLFISSSQLAALTSNMTHRIMGTSPLLYKMIDYSKHKVSFEAEPIYMSMYENQQVISNIMLSGKQSLKFDQLGNGDINPVWINLMSNNQYANYNSQVTFTPSLSQSGVLLHWYDNFESMFIDVKTALVQCKSEVAITEVGGGNGLIPGILNAQQAFTQADWNYGKIGQANHVVGLDNIELRFGGVTQATSNASTYDLFISGFGIIEAPTGTGTKSEWLFEPQVGTNHWGLGFGFEALVCGDDDLRFMIAGNYRYLTPAWETRSFDLLDNGPWSRYLGVQDTYGLPTAPTTLALPGINFFTQQAYIKGRSELNLYTRLSKQFRSSLFELSYNFFCLQQESIGTIKNPTPGYGIYALTGPAGGAGGVTTASKATINEDVTNFDPIGSPAIITVDNFNKASATQGTYVTNTVAARLEIMRKNIVYGFGAAIEAGLSNNAISTWSVWAKFEYQFDNITNEEDHHEYTSHMYDIDPTNGIIEHHEIVMDDANLPQDVIEHVEDEFINDLNNFEFIDEETPDFLNHEETENQDETMETIVPADQQENIAIENISEMQDQMESPQTVVTIEETQPEELTIENMTLQNEPTDITIEETLKSNHDMIEEEPTQEPTTIEDVQQNVPETIECHEDHEISPIADNGLHLLSDPSLLSTEIVEQPQNNQEIVDTTNQINNTITIDSSNDSMSEEEILQKLDSTK